MISVAFAPNETWKDAFLGISLLFKPWSWKGNKFHEKAKSKISAILEISKDDIYFFLTGRSAILNLLKAFALPDQSEILVQAFTCEAVILPILKLNLIPIFVDIEKDTFSMDIEDLKKKLSEKTKVLILQHTFAITPKSRKQILDLASKKGIIVIEDMAHGFLKENFKDNTFKIISFGRSKSFSSVWGGAVICSDKKIAVNLTRIQSGLLYPSSFFILNALIYKPVSVFIKLTFDYVIGKVIHKVLLPFLSREVTFKEKQIQFDEKLNGLYPDALAKMLIVQLENYKKVQDMRQKITKYYSLKLTLQFEGPLIRYPILVKDRDGVLDKLSSNNIYLGSWYNVVIAPENLNLAKLGYKNGSCPNAEYLTKQILNLPTDVSEQEAQKILNLINL